MTPPGARVGRLRIISGELRGRRIDVPDLPGLRPTPDRAREALFSILVGDVPGARVLDAYAGSGSLGLEALSRGAAGAMFVERQRVAAEAIRRAVERFGLGGRCAIVEGDVGVVLERRGGADGPFDLVLADPPYADAAERERFLHALVRSAALAAGAIVVVERPARAQMPGAPAGLGHVRSARWGETASDFWRFDGPFTSETGDG